jgi:hypothetical protein
MGHPAFVVVQASWSSLSIRLHVSTARWLHAKINKVTASQDDDSVGFLTKNILNKLALMGSSPVPLAGILVPPP